MSDITRDQARTNIGLGTNEARADHAEAPAGWDWRVTHVRRDRDDAVTLAVRRAQFPVPQSDAEAHELLDELGDGANLALAELLEVAAPCPDPSRHQAPEAAPAGWDRIEGGGEAPTNPLLPEYPTGYGDDFDGDMRALQMMEIENERADLDLQRERLSHDRAVAGDRLRLAALDAATGLLIGSEASRGMTATERAVFVEVEYRRLLGLLEEADPAGDALDDVQRVPGN